MSQQPSPPPPPPPPPPFSEPGCKEYPIQAQVPPVYPPLYQQQQPPQFDMASPPQVQLPPYFNCKKYTIVTLTSIRIALTVLLVLVVCILAGIASGAENANQSVAISLEVLIAIMVVVGVIAVIFSLIGMIGALKKNYCLCVTFAVLELLNMILYTVETAMVSTAVVILPVSSTILIVVTILYIRDLSYIRQQQQCRSQIVYG